MAKTRRFNFRSEADSVLNVDADSIPDLSPAESIALFRKDDPKPYHKIQAIEYPTKANGWTYTEDFWKSYVSKIARAPIPGSSKGHNMQYGARGPTDLVLIGAKINARGDGTGTVFLKNYILPVGESGDNSVFIKANMAGMVDYSIVSVTKDVIEPTADGGYNRMCVESLSGERNDCVDFGQGAMDMKTNADGQKVNDSGLANAKKLIAAGKIDSVSKWAFTGDDGNEILGDDNWTEYAKFHLAIDESKDENTKERFKYPYGKNDKVYRSALRAIASRAAQSDFQELSDIASELLDTLDKKKNTRKTMEKEEILANLATLKANNGITLADCAKAMGLENQLKTNEDVEALAKFNSISTKLDGGDVLAKVEELSVVAKANSEAAREKAISDVAGPKLNEDQTANDRFNYADRMTQGLTGEKLNSALVTLKDDPIMKRLSNEAADMNSEVNINLGAIKANAQTFNGSAVVL